MQGEKVDVLAKDERRNGRARERKGKKKRNGTIRKALKRGGEMLPRLLRRTSRSVDDCDTATHKAIVRIVSLLGAGREHLFCATRKTSCRYVDICPVYSNRRSGSGLFIGRASNRFPTNFYHIQLSSNHREA